MFNFDKNNEFLKLLLNITLLSEVLPLIFCIFYIKKINTKSLKVFFVYTFIQSVFSFWCIYAFYFLDSYGIYMLLLRAHLIIEYIIVGLFFFLIVKNKTIKSSLFFSIIPFLCYNFYDYFNNGSGLFGTLPTLIEFIVFIFIIIVYFFEKMNTTLDAFSQYSIHFWICVGLFVYFTGNFFYILLVENSKHSDQSIKNQLNVIYSSVTIVKNIILGLAFLNKENDEDSSPNIEFPEDTSWGAIHQPIKNS